MPRNSASDNWNTIDDEAQVKFDTDGDVYTGKLLSRDVKQVEGNRPLRQAHFSGTGEYAGSDHFINEGHDLSRKLDKVPTGAEVRITRTGEMDTGAKSPMVTYKVDWR